MRISSWDCQIWDNFKDIQCVNVRPVQNEPIAIAPISFYKFPNSLVGQFISLVAVKYNFSVQALTVFTLTWKIARNLISST